MPVAATFAVRDEQGFSLSDIARLDTMVTVVDGSAFLADFGSTLRLAERGQQAGPDDDRGVVDLLCEQVEFADVIVVSKVDQVDDEVLQDTLAVLRGLNRDAKLLLSSFGDVPLAELLDTGRFDFERAQRAPGWVKELRGEHTPETEEYGIGSFVYRSRRPFHPARFARALQSGMPGVIRSKGWFWLANRMDWVGELNTVGARCARRRRVLVRRTRSRACWAGGHRRCCRPRRCRTATWAGRGSRPIAGARRCRGRKNSRMRRHAAMQRLWHPLWGTVARNWW
jgi:G3E family GTPase